MNNLQTQINTYLEHCQDQKRLDTKTIKAYRIDLKQFHNHFSNLKISDITPDMLEKYISDLHQEYKPKTVKRKIASIKALFHYLEYKESISTNPFNKMQIKFRESIILPKTIPLHTLENPLIHDISATCLRKDGLSKEKSVARYCSYRTAFCYRNTHFRIVCTAGQRC